MHLFFDAMSSCICPWHQNTIVVSEMIVLIFSTKMPSMNNGFNFFLVLYISIISIPVALPCIIYYSPQKRSLLVVVFLSSL